MDMTPEQRRQYLLDAMGIQRWVRRTAAPAPVSGAGPREAVATPAGHPVPVSGDDIAALGWDELAARVAGCTLCAELAASRTQTVFGVGDRQADWLFIGEAPGAEEDRRGEPFVGRAGQLLDSMLFALGLKRGQGVYIANILKCRPPGNRDPHAEESQACRPYLDRQIDLIRPRIIVALGRIAAQNLLHTDAPLARLRGRALSYRDIPLVVTYHPAYLLRQPADKRKAWDDLRLARRVMGV
jgi:uracil-DNA glycosylase